MNFEYYFEYKALAIMTLFFLFAWLPSSIGKYQSFGGKWLASNRDQIPNKSLAPWAQRAERAYVNLKDYFPAFAVAIIILGINNKFNSYTSWAAGLYVLGRIMHFLAYTIGHINLRFISYLTGLIANIYLLIQIFI